MSLGSGIWKKPKQPIPDAGVKEAPDPGSTTLVTGPRFFDHEKHIHIKIVLY
jgi:hypothetical protein